MKMSHVILICEDKEYNEIGNTVFISPTHQKILTIEDIPTFIANKYKVHFENLQKDALISVLKEYYSVFLVNKLSSFDYGLLPEELITKYPFLGKAFFRDYFAFENVPHKYYKDLFTFMDMSIFREAFSNLNFFSNIFPIKDSTLHIFGYFGYSKE